MLYPDESCPSSARSRLEFWGPSFHHNVITGILLVPCGRNRYRPSSHQGKYGRSIMRRQVSLSRCQLVGQDGFRRTASLYQGTMKCSDGRLHYLWRAGDRDCDCKRRRCLIDSPSKPAPHLLAQHWSLRSARLFVWPQALSDLCSSADSVPHSDLRPKLVWA